MDFIPILETGIGGSSVNSVNAKDIHRFLGIKTAYTTWLNRAIEKYDFVENEDFISELKESTGGRPEKVFVVSIDMAKELCMIEPNDMGKKTRKFFIEIEKKGRLPQLTVSEQISLIAQGHSQINERITTIEQTMRIHGWQQKALLDAKNERVYELLNGDTDKDHARKVHTKVWSLFKKHFSIPRYSELPIIKYEDGMNFIKSVKLVDLV